MSKNVYLLILILLVIFPTSLDSQEKEIKKAQKVYQAGEYHEAAELLKESYKFMDNDEQKNETVFKIARCYHILNKVKLAVMWFRKAIRRGYEKPKVYLYYAQALLADEEYEKAKDFFKKYKEKAPDDPRGEIGLQSCKVAKNLKENPTGYKVEEAHFFNSKDHDYAPAYGRNDYKVIYFTSSRKKAAGEHKHGATGQKFSDIFSAQKDKQGSWSVPSPLGENINTRDAEGTPAFDQSFNQLYFTRCIKSNNEPQGCHIRVAQKKDGDTWGEGKALNILENDSLVAAHPTISSDGNTLYFVSNKAGGIGGKDIWKVEGGSGNWGEPKNLGDNINTPGNELFPYIHPDGTLYFSSDAHKGMGGLDIYKATQKNDKWQVSNMGYPINSNRDDFGITFQQETERGFLTSNRGYGDDDDIYSFHLPKIRLNIEGFVMDKTTLQPIKDARVKLVASDGMTINTSTNDKGRFKFMLTPGKDYVFIAEKQEYLKDKAKLTTKGLERSKNFEDTIYLASTKKAIELPNIFYEVDKWNLKPESKEALNELIALLNENPNVRIELRAHTDFRGGKDYNQELSQKRAQSVVDYLIKHGIDKDRLVAKGYGETQPKIIDEKMHNKVPFFEVGTEMSPEFIKNLKSEDKKEIAHQINRRTEFKVIDKDYNK